MGCKAFKNKGYQNCWGKREHSQRRLTIMRLNRFAAMSLPQRLVFVLLMATSMFFVPSVLAQGTTQVPAPELKLLSIKVERKASTKLDIQSIPSNNNLRPTETFVYRPELGNAPKAGDQYAQYVRTPVQADYAVLNLTNESAKTIKSIDWEYTSPHFKGDKIIIYEKTSSQMKIGSGQTAALSKKLPSDGYCRMRVGAMFGQQTLSRICGQKNQKSTGWHLVEARLLKITYEDGTVWKP
jgi:hypothetical protein